MSGAVRDLHLSYPDQFQTDVRSPCNEIYQFNPYITAIKDGEGELIEMEYPLIHSSGATGVHFSDGHRVFLQGKLGLPIKKRSMRPEIYLSQAEKNWISKVVIEHGYEGKFWLINAGAKSDYALKFYPYYQEVVNLLKNKIQFVQVGHKEHSHPPLDGVINFVGKTNIRELFRLSHQAEGAVCAVSLQMVIMQAFMKPCVVINGGREGMRWQAINDHRFLHTIGALPCCIEDGCWQSKPEDCYLYQTQCKVAWDMYGTTYGWLGDVNRKKEVDVKVEEMKRAGQLMKSTLCMEIIKPEDIASAVLMHYEGRRLSCG
jgi:hypothetical protein